MTALSESIVSAIAQLCDPVVFTLWSPLAPFREARQSVAINRGQDSTTDEPDPFEMPTARFYPNGLEAPLSPSC